MLRMMRSACISMSGEIWESGDHVDGEGVGGGRNDRGSGWWRLVRVVG